MRDMKILGVDQSLTKPGYALFEDGQLTVCEVLNTAKLGVSGYERVQAIVDRALSLAHGCDAVVVEGPSMMSKGRALTGLFGLYGTLTQDLWRAGHSPWIVAPSARAKYATGSGTSDKKKVLAAILSRFDFDPRIIDDNTADAVALASLVARKLGHPVDDDYMVSANAREALDKVQEPQ